MSETSEIMEFRQLARETSRPNVWGEIYRDLPGGTDDPVLAIIETKVKAKNPSATREEIINLADEYDKLWQEAGVNLDPENINHNALIDFFLEHRENKTETGLTRRRFVQMGLLLPVAAALTYFLGSRGGTEVKAEQPTPTSLPAKQEAIPLPDEALFDQLIKPFVEEG